MFVRQHRKISNCWDIYKLVAVILGKQRFTITYKKMWFVFLTKQRFVFFRKQQFTLRILWFVIIRNYKKQRFAILRKEDCFCRKIVVCFLKKANR